MTTEYRGKILTLIKPEFLFDVAVKVANSLDTNCIKKKLNKTEKDDYVEFGNFYIRKNSKSMNDINIKALTDYSKYYKKIMYKTNCLENNKTNFTQSSLRKMPSTSHNMPKRTTIAKEIIQSRKNTKHAKQSHKILF